MVSLENVSKSFGEKAVLAEFSCVFEDGKRYVVTGPSGVGKTTLLRLICGLIRPDSGSVNVGEGTRVRAVFQEDRLLPWKTVLENVRLENGGEAHARGLLSELGLEKETGAFPASLSGGMSRRVAIARALCAEPDVLLLDEPFNGLDDEMKTRTAALIFDKMKGKTVIVITHDTAPVAEYADETLTLQPVGDQ